MAPDSPEHTLRKTPNPQQEEVVAKRPPWKRILALLGSMALLILVFRKIQVPLLWQTLKETHPGWLAAALMAFGGQCLFAGIRWHLVLSATRTSIHGLQTLRLVLMAHAFGFVFMGPLAGDVFKCRLQSKWARQTMASLLSTTPLDRLFGLLGGLCFGFLMIFMGWLNDGLPALPAPKKGWGVIILVSITLLFWLLKKALQEPPKDTSRKQGIMGPFLESLKNHWQGVRSNPRVAVGAIGSAIMVHFCLTLVMVFCILSSTQVEYPWWQILWVFPVISMLTAIPVSISGAGVREGSTMILLGFYGIPSEKAVAAAMLTWCVQALWALGGYALLKRERRAWRHTSEQELPGKTPISIILPTWNEADQIPRLARHLQEHAPDCEWILADGGSHDATCSLAKSFGFRVINSEKGRGLQLDQGLQAANGDQVVFMHVDTRLPDRWEDAMLRCLKDPRVVGGAFFKRFDHPHWLMRGSRIRCLLMMVLMGRAFGDQCLFARRDILMASGGVPRLPLMEDLAMCRQLRRHGDLALADACVMTSARRFRQRGVLRTYGLMGWLWLRYALGTPAEALASRYHPEEKTPT